MEPNQVLYQTEPHSVMNCLSPFTATRNFRVCILLIAVAHLRVFLVKFVKDNFTRVFFLKIFNSL